MAGDDAIVEIHAFLKGRVQGVGCRATVRHYASQLGLLGTVRNLDDGSVEVYVQGRHLAIQQLFQQLQLEGGAMRLSEIAQREVFPLNVYSDFHIVH